MPRTAPSFLFWGIFQYIKHFPILSVDGFRSVCCPSYRGVCVIEYSDWKTAGSQGPTQCVCLGDLSVKRVLTILLLFISIYLFPFTVKTCRSLSGPKHGYIFSKTGLLGFAYTQGVKVTFACNTYYRLVGSSSRTCLPSGYWSNLAPHCGMCIFMVSSILKRSWILLCSGTPPYSHLGNTVTSILRPFCLAARQNGYTFSFLKNVVNTVTH